MPTTYTNVAIDTVLKGVEALLETEYEGETAIYIAKDYEKQGRGKSIRLEIDGSEQVARVSTALTRRYTVTVSCYLKPGQRTSKKQEEEVNELSQRAQRVLEENATYRPSDTYKWHDGQVEPVDNNPELTEAESEEEHLSVVRFDYLVSVTETGSSL